MVFAKFNLPQADAQLPAPGTNGLSPTEFLSTRRSTPVKTMNPDSAAPSDDELQEMLQAAMRVPDHRKLGPWRIIIFKGDARSRFGQILKERHAELNPDASPSSLDEEANRLLRAPLCLTVVSSPDHSHKTPVWEQELSAGALCMNLLYTAHAAGYGACWISEWWAFDKEIDRKLGLKDGERVAGHIFIGESRMGLFERPRPNYSDRVTHWDEASA
ncbi:nitroreductase family protein [Ponticaulis profundi]|uniref:Putative NAD(P)H nitroreductase n=1 Tax=Ponticaulis profundi TaxID=2665222 RepID=A0ABW1S782_9PROT